ncbi:hypothetical protein FOCC_FOCC009067 [Frankliniella occidentalis]|uniref:Uncharacterized protein LOC113215198 n=1 Tax=Frankliniella occidentalis TaxID=133901 RepID=A0A6J1TID1_FRAOC|nr:uncharacterized protein LOC113215198 [Frankliniella occidentalis]KAE8744344.1 hypothetical protein FOCC_FOCC009067 [Frankliniella occidentalis]
MTVRALSLTLLLCLLGGLHGQEIDPDAEVFEVAEGGTVVVNQPTLPEINVNTSNVIHNNIPGPTVVEVPAAQPAAEVVTVPVPVPTVATTAAPAIVNPAVVNPTVVNPTVVNPTGMRYGVGVVPLGSLLMGGGLGGMGLGGMGLGGMGLGAAMMPRLIIGR